MHIKRILLYSLLLTSAVIANAQKEDDLAPPANVATPAPKQTAPQWTKEDLTSHTIPKGVDINDPGVISFFYNGHRRSQIDPCGCVTGPQGGLDREARLINFVEEMGVPTLKADCGSFLRDAPSDRAITTTKFILQGMADMKYQVMNLSYLDIGAGMRLVEDTANSTGIKFISASLLNDKGEPLFPPYHIVAGKLRNGEEVRFGFIGVTRERAKTGRVRQSSSLSPGVSNRWVDDPSLQFAYEHGKGAAQEKSDKPAFKIGDMRKALEKYMPKLRSECDIVILLAYEKVDPLSKFVAALPDELAPDIAVAGDFVIAQDDVMTSAPNMTRVVTAGFEGRQVGHMLMLIENKKIKQVANRVMDIPQMVPPLPAISKYVDANAKAVKKPKEEAPERAGVSNIYSGAASCQNCHKSQFEQWETTRHAKAIKTLVAKNQQHNHDCLRCHVTGYKDENGFTDYRVTPQMGNVQCEVCHGPGREHVVDKRLAAVAAERNREYKPEKDVAPMNMSFSKDFCVKCHDQQNDPNFEYERDIQFVNHTRVAQRPVDTQTTGSSHM